MGQDQYYRMLTKVYGTEGAAGVYKLVSADRGGISTALERAAGPEGVAAEIAEESARQTTLEAGDARAKAVAMEISLDITEEEKYMKSVRDIGEAYQRRRGIRKPFGEAWRRLWLPKEFEKEHAAYLMWRGQLTAEELAEIDRGPYGMLPDPHLRYWQEEMTPKERYGSLTGMPQGPTVNVDHHYHNETIYNPVVGDRGIGARSDPNDL